MKFVSPVSDLIQHTIQLYLELLLTAEELHDLGADSGIKRTILLHLLQHGETPVDDLKSIYPLPPKEGIRIVEDLIQKGWASRYSKQKTFYLSLTLPGSTFAERLVQAEAEFFRKSPVPLPLANLREAAATLEIFQETMKKIRENHRTPKVVGL